MSATLVVDMTGQIRGWSRDAEALLGYAEAEAMGQSIELIIPPHLRGRHHAGFGCYLQTGVSNLPEVTISPAMHDREGAGLGPPCVRREPKDGARGSGE